jgi:drug/metabolite transporter (DMT)-like permease
MSDLTAHDPPRARLWAAFTAIYLIWGSTYLAIRFAIETMPPFLMAGTRFLIAGSILYGWMLWRRIPRPTLIQWRSAAIVGGLLMLGGNGAVVWAEQRVPSSLTALMVATVPIWMGLINWAWFGGPRPSRRMAAGLALGFAGIVVLIGPGEMAGGGRIDLLGAAALLFSSVSWAFGSLYSRHAPLPTVPLLSTAMQMLGGGTLMLIAGTLMGEWARFDPSAITLRSLLAYGYLIVFGSLIAFSAYVWLLRVAMPARVATYAYVNPVIAVLLGWALAGEPLTLRTGLAALVIVAAVVIVSTRGR